MPSYYPIKSSGDGKKAQEATLIVTENLATPIVRSLPTMPCFHIKKTCLQLTEDEFVDGIITSAMPQGIHINGLVNIADVPRTSGIAKLDQVAPVS